MLTRERVSSDPFAYKDESMHVEPRKEGLKGIILAWQQDGVRWVFSADQAFGHRFLVISRKMREDGISESSDRAMEIDEIEAFLRLAHKSSDPAHPKFNEYSSLVSLAEKAHQKLLNPEPKTGVLTV